MTEQESGEDGQSQAQATEPTPGRIVQLQALEAGKATKQRSRYKSADDKKAALLAAVEAGSTLKDAFDRLGIKPELYAYYRKSDPEFRVKMDNTRISRNFTEPKGWQGDFATFRDTYFRLEYPTPAFHMDIIKRLEYAPPMSITMVLVPPEHGKSTLIEDWINYKLAVDPNHRITVVSKGQGQARKMLSRVQRRMTDAASFPQYIGRFGPFYGEGQEKEGKPWTRDYFTVAKADHDERDYSLQTLGWSGQVYGSRVDTLILDDIQTRDNLTQVEKMMDKFRLEFLTRGGRNGKTIVVGTRIEMGDFYEQLMEKDIVTEGQLFVMPAVNYDNKPLWPEKWPIEALNTMRKNVGEKMWWCGYQQKPSLAGSATFSDAMLEEAKDYDRRLGRGPGNQSNHGLPVVLGLDPALGGGNALVACAYDRDGIFVLDAQKDYNLSRNEEIFERIEDFAARYRPNDVVIEIAAFQRGMARDDRLLAIARRYGFRLHEHTTNKNKLDPVFGVGSMAGSFIRNEVSIPWGDPVTIARMEGLVAELKGWRPNIPTRLLVQDYVMALWFAWLFIISRRKLTGSSAVNWKRTGVPYQRPTEYTAQGALW